MRIVKEHFNIKKTEEWLLGFWKNIQLQPEEMEADDLMHLFCGLAACHHFEKRKDTEEVILFLDRYFGEKNARMPSGPVRVCVSYIPQDGCRKKHLFS